MSSLALVASAVIGAFLLTVSPTMPSAIAVAATATCPADGCVYIVKGTNSAFNQVPDSAYPMFAYTYNRAVGAPAPQPVQTPYPYYLVPFPAGFWPITPPGYFTSPTFDESVAVGVANLEGLRPVSADSPNDVLWGYSQGATVVTQYKRDYNAQPNPPATPPTFVLVANPNRPNGGILERGVGFGTIPIIGVTFSGATPTTTAGAPAGTITTYDIARQYDGIADAPVNPLNLVADANAVMGFYYLHGRYVDVDPAASNLIDQGTYGDTQYYLIATYPLPLLMPLASIPVIGFPLADTLDPLLRVIVESAYDRSTSPGEPTPANPLYFPDPATFGTNLLVAVPTGLDNGISDVAGTRPLGTTRPGAYGVGGPPTPPPTPTTEQPPSPVAPNNDVAEADSTTAAASPRPSADSEPGVKNSGPKLNVSRPPLWAAPGGQASGSANGSQSTASDPVGTTVSGVRTSVESALGAISKIAAGAATPGGGTAAD